jgi:hypothetical protein
MRSWSWLALSWIDRVAVAWVTATAPCCSWRLANHRSAAWATRQERRGAGGCHDLAHFQVFASLAGTVASERVVVISALLFGFPRYAGTPGQVIGVLAATFLS